MAIPLVIVRFTTLRPARTSVGLVAYIGRRTVRDRGRRWAYGHIAGDLVHEEVLLPSDVPDHYGDPIALARAMDDAEPQEKLADRRQRYPQPGLHLVLALPPDDEMHLDEVALLTRDFVRSLVGHARLGAYIAIHDPAVKHNARLRRNRHAHAVLTLRTFDGEHLSRHKLRDVVARVRTATGGPVAGPRPTYVAEGRAWPDLWCGAQNRLFLEFGSTARVQPIAARAERHYDRLTWRTRRAEVEADRALIVDENRKMAFGDPPALIAALSRGRSTLLLADLSAFLRRVILDPDRRQERLTEIRAHDDVVALAYEGRVDRITTDAIHARLSEASAAIRAAVDDTDARIRCVRGEDADAVRAGIERAVSRVTGLADDGIVVVGAALSHTECVGDHRASRMRLRDLLARGAVRSLSLIIAPRAEQIRDVDLAELIALAVRIGCHLILGIDDGAADGVLDRRLAVFAAAMLDPRPLPQDLPPDALRELAARRLRAGYVSEGIAALASAVTMRFGLPAPVSETTVVIADRTQWARPDPSDGSAASPGSGPDLIDEAACVPGAHMIAQRTDYAVLPPVVRAGRIYEIVARPTDGPSERELRMRDVVTNAETTLPLATVRTWFRPARFLSIREARALKGHHLAAPVQMVISDPAKAWASLLLAAELGPVPSIHLDVLPQVAAAPHELVARIGAGLPGALASERTACIDHASREQVAIASLLTSLVPAPEPAERVDHALTDSDLLKLPEALAEVIARSDHVREGVNRQVAELRTGRRPPDPGGDPLAEALRPLVARTARRGRKPAYADELDLPEAITANERATSSPMNAWALPKVAELQATLAKMRSRRDQTPNIAIEAAPPVPSSGEAEDAENVPGKKVRP